MTRAALGGAVMGVLLGGMILAVMSLQLAVVEWPVDALADPRDTDWAVAAPPPDGRIVSPAPGPTAIGLALGDLSQGPERADVTVVQLIPGRALPRADLPAFDAAGTPAPPVADLRSRLSVTPPDALSARRFRTVAPAAPSIDVARLITPLPPLSPGRPAWQDAGAPPPATPTPTVAPVPPLLTSQTRARPTGPMPREATAAPSPGARPLGPAQASAPLLPEGPAPMPRDAAYLPVPSEQRPERMPRALPLPIAGAPRAPLVLWLAADTPAGAVTPDWLTVPGAVLHQVPPPDRPEQLARFLADLRNRQGPQALLVAGKTGWPAGLLAPVLDRAADANTPLLLAARADEALAAMLRARGLRSVQAYTWLEPGDAAADRAKTFARIADRARRDGVVMVVVPRDPALWAAVERWHNTAGAGLEPAKLSDLFGG